MNINIYKYKLIYISISTSISISIYLHLFVLKNNFFEFNNDIFQQIPGTAIGTKSAPPYTCIFMDQIEIKFLRTQSHQPIIWFRYVDDIVFIWTHGEEKLEEFMEGFNAFNPNIQFTYESSKKSIAFLDLDVALYNRRLESNCLH